MNEKTQNEDSSRRILNVLKISSGKGIKNQNELEKYYYEQFKKIAEYLINEAVIYLPGNQKYRMIELEFYFNENSSNNQKVSYGPIHNYLSPFVRAACWSCSC